MSVILTGEQVNQVLAALNGQPRECRYHGTEFGPIDTWAGGPRCESCRQPWRVVRAIKIMEPGP